VNLFSIYEELDPENDGLPYALYHMAAMTLNNGNLDLANILMNRVKKLYQKEENNHGLAEALYTLGMIDYQQGMSLNEKGLYYYQKSHFESADKNLEQAASIRKMVVGNNSPRVADILNVQALANAQIGFNNMGGLLYNIKSLKKAEKLFKEAINIYSNIEDIEELKSNQLSLANTLVNYAQFKYRWNRDGVDAIPMMKIALKIYNAQKGPESEESKMVINAVQRMIPKSWGEKIVKEQNELIKHPEKIDKTPVVVEF